MSAIAGLAVLGDYDQATAGDAVDQLLDLIPNPDAPHGSGAVAGGGFLDEMSPGAAAQIRVELIAMKAAIGDFEGA